MSSVCHIPSADKKMTQRLLRVINRRELLNEADWAWEVLPWPTCWRSDTVHASAARPRRAGRAAFPPKGPPDHLSVYVRGTVAARSAGLQAAA